MRIKANITGWLICGIPLVGFVLFHAIPLVVSLLLSFTELKGYDFTQATFIGFDNFLAIFRMPLFWNAVKVTLVYCLTVPMTMVGGFVIAYLLSRKIVARNVFRSIFFIPYVCSTVSVGLMWKWIYEPNAGVLNAFLSLLGVGRIEWLYDARTFMIAVFVVVLWSGTGFSSLLYQSALANVNQSYYEAAQLDGAGKGTILFRITIPMTTPTTFYLWTTGLISGLQVFAILQILTSGTSSTGGPDFAGYSVVYLLYDMAFTYPLDYGLGIASACAWILSLFIFLVTRINFMLQNKWVVYEE